MAEEQISVVVAGALGKMGRETVKVVAQAPDMQLVGAVDKSCVAEDVGQVIGLGTLGVQVSDDIQGTLFQASQTSQRAVMVDFTHPDSVYENIRASVSYGVRPVVGTTGLTEAQIRTLREFTEKAGVGCLIAPNFSIGMILLQQMAVQASQYFDHVEIIELHHNQKADAPSGTAVQTAQLLGGMGKEYNPSTVQETEQLPGSRGGRTEDQIRIHSVRLPGLVAHQEVIFGGLGQTLTLRHDTTDRMAFMPGVLLGIRKVLEVETLVYGLEKILQ